MLGLEKLRPKERHSKITEIEFESLKKKGYKAVLFDIDNTLIRYGYDELDSGPEKVLEKLRKDFKLMAVSNGCPLEEKYLQKLLSMDVIMNARKPFKKSFNEALSNLSVKPENTIMIGDKFLTDVWGANRVGIYSIYVSPLSLDEPFHLRIARKIENFIEKLL